MSSKNKKRRSESSSSSSSSDSDSSASSHAHKKRKQSYSSGSDQETKSKRRYHPKEKLENVKHERSEKYRDKKEHDNGDRKENDYRPKKENDYRDRKENDYRPKKENDYRDRKENDYRPKKENDYRDRKENDHRDKRENDYKPSESKNNRSKYDSHQRNHEREDRQKSNNRGDDRRRNDYDQDRSRNERDRERNKSRRSPERNRFNRNRRSRSKSFDHANATWGKNDQQSTSKKPSDEKQKPNFGLSGKLTEETNTYRGVVIKYSEPPEARIPKRRYRLYQFKDGKMLQQALYIHRQSGYLVGRDRKIVDFPVDHPSCSKQHAVIQYRLVPFTRLDGSVGKRVRPYLIDLESANGTFINNKKIEPKKYYELLDKDMIKFGFSSREYIVMHENSKDEAEDDDVKSDDEVKKEKNKVKNEEVKVKKED